MVEKLTLPEWRLFLLSECLKAYGDAYENTTVFRATGKDSILCISDDDLQYLNTLVREDHCEGIRTALRKEWKFSGKVVDGGKGNYTICEYCHKREIRYQYLCVNVINGTWLKLGSVCVGRIVHGEAKMNDREFSKKYVSGLEAMRVQKMKEAETAIVEKPMRQLRLEQHGRIGHATKFLRENGHGDDTFYKSLESQWKAGKLLSAKQEKALMSLYTNVYNKRVREGVVTPEPIPTTATPEEDIENNIP